MELAKTLPLRRDFSSLLPEPRAFRAPQPAPRPQPPRVLLLAALFRLPYRTLRCISTAGAQVYVLGGPGAVGLRASRYCREFIACESPIDGRPYDELGSEINRVIKACSIDLVAAGDAPSTRSLVGLVETLDAPSFPLPDMGAFDILNNKWRFTELCKELNIACPDSRLYGDVARLFAECDSGEVRPPLIAKPLSLDGGAGCIQVANEKQLKKLAKISYSPIIVQDYIEGVDIGASIFCRDGEVEAFLVHNYVGGVYTAFREPGIYASISQIAWRLRLSGIFNFDMRLTPDGEIVFLECNPRVFYKITMSMMAGINFLGHGFPWRSDIEKASFSSPVTVRFPKAILGSLPTPWKLDSDTWRVLKFIFDDPLPYLREKLGFERGR